MMEMSTRDIKTETIGTMAKMTEEIIVETEIPAEPKMRIIMFKDPRMTKKEPITKREDKKEPEPVKKDD